MKIPLVLFAAWWFAMMPGAVAQQSGEAFASEMSVNADVQEKFYAQYPDLTDERDVVAGALRRVAPQEMARMNADEAGAMLAERARTILSLRSPQEWQRKAVSLYPELGVAGSEFNKLFLERYRELERTSPQFQQERSWPVLLAKRCADELRARAEPPQAVAGSHDSGVAPGKLESPKVPAPARSSRWLAALSVVLLAGMLWLPAGWLFRISHAFGRDESVTLWQRALRPATWAYLAVAFLALFKTFAANADQTLGNRFGITLLVSLLAGLATCVPAFVIAWGFGCWRRRSASHSEELVGVAAKPSADSHHIVAK